MPDLGTFKSEQATLTLERPTSESFQESYNRDFIHAVEEYAQSLSEPSQWNRAGSGDAKLSVEELGSIAGRSFIHWISEKSRPTSESVRIARSELQRVFDTEQQVNIFLSGFLAEYYCSQALKNAGFDVVEVDNDQDVHFATDLKVVLNECDDFAIEGAPGKFGALALSIKHVAYYPIGEQVVWPCRTIEEFATNLGEISLNYFHILTDTSSPQSKQFASETLHQSGMIKQLGGQEFIDSHTSQMASKIIDTAARDKVEQLRSRLLRSYAQMHGLNLHTESTKNGYALELQPRINTRSGKTMKGVQETDPTTQTALVLMPGQNTTIRSRDGRLVKAFEGFTAPQELSNQFYTELAERPDLWSPANRPVGGTIGRIRLH